MQSDVMGTFLQLRYQKAQVKPESFDYEVGAVLGC